MASDLTKLGAGKLLRHSFGIAAYTPQPLEVALLDAAGAVVGTKDAILGEVAFNGTVGALVQTVTNAGETFGLGAGAYTYVGTVESTTDDAIMADGQVGTTAVDITFPAGDLKWEFAFTDPSTLAAGAAALSEGGSTDLMNLVFGATGATAPALPTVWYIQIRDSTNWNTILDEQSYAAAWTYTEGTTSAKIENASQITFASPAATWDYGYITISQTPAPTAAQCWWGASLVTPGTAAAGSTVFIQAAGLDIELNTIVPF